MAEHWGERFPVEGNDPVLFKVLVGHGQLGESTVSLDGDVIGEDGDYPLTVLLEGSPDELVGKELSCVTTVINVRKETNTVSVIYEISQGERVKREPLKQKRVAQGQLRNFGATIEFETAQS